jgi:TDG/mug DNA glycosylase family protein
VSQAVPDVVGPGLRVLFCGINPGLRSAEEHRHFARPGNRFWKVLHLAGFTDRVLQPEEQWELVPLGLGITNLVDRPSTAAAELSADELRRGGAQLVAKVTALRPEALAMLGMQAYRRAFGLPKAEVGRQPEGMGDSAVWLLPNTSGLQARYQLDDLVAMFAAVRESLAP